MKRLYIIPPLLLQTIIWIPVRLLLKIFSAFKVAGVENIKDIKGKIIFASSHSTELDPILIPAALPFLSRLIPMFYTSLEKRAYNSFGWKSYLYGGTFFKAWGAYQVYRGLQNYEQSLQNHLEILRDNKSVCIFPEGRKTTTNCADGAKGGVAFLCHKTNTPVVPVMIHGTKEISVKNFLLRKNKISVYFGEPLYPKSIFGNINSVVLNREHDGYKKASQIIMEKIIELSPLKEKAQKDTTQQRVAQDYQDQKPKIVRGV